MKAPWGAHQTGGVTKQARTAILRLGKRPRSTEEMMEAIECLRTTRAEEQVQRVCRTKVPQIPDFVVHRQAPRVDGRELQHFNKT